MSEPSVPELPVLHVCVTCRAGRDLAEGETPQGQQLYEAVQAGLAATPAPPLVLRPVKCLASCEQGCAAVISAPGKWSTLLGRLSPALVRDLLAYGAAYTASASGAVLPSRRPESLRKVVLGRVPSLVATEAAA